MSAPDTEALVRIFAEVVDREAKKRGLNAVEVCGALGATAGVVVAQAVPRAADFDGIMLEMMAVGFRATLNAVRAKQVN